jgi:hypothetical protein
MIRVFSRDKNGIGFWYDQTTGHRISKPDVGDLRTDKIGRIIDDTGTNVSPRVVYYPPVTTPQIQNETRIYKKDKNDRGYWFWKESGQRAKKPTASDVVWDKKFRPRDDKGHFVPKSAIKADITPAKETVRKRVVFAPEEPPISSEVQKDFRYPTYTTTETPQLIKDRYTNFSHMNLANVDKIDEIFLKTFMAHTAKGPFEPEDISIYKYGMLVRTDTFLSDEEKDYIRAYLGNFPETSVRFIKEELSDSYLVSFGSNVDPKNYREVLADLRDRIYSIANLIDWMDMEGIHYEWADYWDTDHEHYEQAAA